MGHLIKVRCHARLHDRCGLWVLREIEKAREKMTKLRSQGNAMGILVEPPGNKRFDRIDTS